MRKGRNIAALLVAALLCAACAPAALPAEQPVLPEVKVIVDTDMGYMTDDMLALFGLLQADRLQRIRLLGITTVGGNTFVAPGTFDTLAILDAVGRSDVPVYMGADAPLAGFQNLEELFSRTPPLDYTGAYEGMEQHTTDYLAADALITTSQYPAPTSRIQPQSAVDFLIEQVHAYPGEVTILALGPCMNVAQAIQRDAEFASLAAGVYYMGGCFSDVDGEAAPAEFNWWYDPDAVDICLRAPWRSQTILPNRIGSQCKKGEDVYLRYKAQPKTPVIEMLLDGLSPIYEGGGDEEFLDCWDPALVAAFLHPDLIVKEETRDVAISTAVDETFAVSRSWKEGTGPEGAAACRLILEIDRDPFWDYMAALYGAQ